MYISNQTADLEKCKFGLLPKNLDIYFNNHQELFLHKNQYNLVENSNLLLRRGIDNNKRNNILETMSVIYDRSYNNFINKLKDAITPELFITLNNGELIQFTLIKIVFLKQMMILINLNYSSINIKH